MEMLYFFIFVLLLAGFTLLIIIKFSKVNKVKPKPVGKVKLMARGKEFKGSNFQNL